MLLPFGAGGSHRAGETSHAARVSPTSAVFISIFKILPILMFKIDTPCQTWNQPRNIDGGVSDHQLWASKVMRAAWCHPGTGTVMGGRLSSSHSKRFKAPWNLKFLTRAGVLPSPAVPGELCCHHLYPPAPRVHLYFVFR